MSREALKTAGFVVAALVLVVAAAWIQPEAVTPEMFHDQGEPLFPEFRDVLAVKSIEIIGYNEQQAAAIPLKVEFRNGRWVLPSHFDYPAEVEEQLAKATAALFGLRKDEVVSDRVEAQADYGVIDPMDANNPSLAGRGKRVTLRDAYGAVLADVILGKPVPGRPGYRYVRLPGSNRVYAVKTEADPSARFEDWVAPNLLGLSEGQIRRIAIHRYSIDETLGRLTNIQRVVLVRQDGGWRVEEGSAPQARIQEAVKTLATLRIRGVRPKPKPLAEQLEQGRLELTLESVVSLRRYGFFLTPGGLLANEGEMRVETAEGLVYSLRFGELAQGMIGESSDADQESKALASEQHRFLLVTVSYDPQVEARYNSGRSDPGRGQSRARALNRQFAGWYYVISGEDFERLRLGVGGR